MTHLLLDIIWDIIIMTPTDRQCSLSHEHANVHICSEQLRLHIYIYISMVNVAQVMFKLYPLASQSLDLYYKLILT